MIIFATVYIDFCTYMFIITLIVITYKSILIYRRLSCRKVHHENQFVQKHGSMIRHLPGTQIQVTANQCSQHFKRRERHKTSMHRKISFKGQNVQRLFIACQLFL